MIFFLFVSLKILLINKIKFNNIKVFGNCIMIFLKLCYVFRNFLNKYKMYDFFIMIFLRNLLLFLFMFEDEYNICG